MGNQPTRRQAQLRESIGLLRELEDVLSDDPDQRRRLQIVRNSLEQAGAEINSRDFSRHITDATGAMAGIAVGAEHDQLAERATRITDEGVDLTAEPLSVVERETDDRGRLSIGTEYADSEVEVAVLEATSVDEADPI